MFKDNVFNHLEKERVCVIYGLNPYRAVNTPHFGYKNQTLNGVQTKDALCSENT
jgi:hypothetical protein